MAQSAYIYFVEGSSVSSMTLDDVLNQLQDYVNQTSKTGEQLDWNYSEAAFPYTIERKSGEEHLYFFLKGKHPRYKHIVFGVGSKQREHPADEQSDEPAGDPAETHYIQVVLPDDSTYGDKSKGNEYCKYIARRLQAELHLFNGRVMYYNPRK